MLKAAPLPILLSVALMAGCSDGGAGNPAKPGAASSGVKVSAALAEDPCALLPRQVVADHFSLPVDDINQIAVSSACQYSWKDKTNVMSVNLHIWDVGDSPAATREYFDRATRSMDAQEVADGMNKIRSEAAARGVDTPATEAVAGEVGGRGIQYEDYAGVGDKARFKPSGSELNVLVGNLYFAVAGYHGPKMTPPTEFNMQAMQKAAAQWQSDTAPERTATADALAKLIINGL